METHNTFHVRRCVQNWLGHLKFDHINERTNYKDDPRLSVKFMLDRFVLLYYKKTGSVSNPTTVLTLSFAPSHVISVKSNKFTFSSLISDMSFHNL